MNVDQQVIVVLEDLLYRTSVTPENVLAVLRDNGFDVYRPDDVEILWECETHRFQYVPDWPGKEPIRCGVGADAWADDDDAEPCLLIRYRLVPVGGDS